MEQIQETQTPQPETEQTVQNDTASLLAEKEAEIALLKQKEVELQKQKEHWREKYERDITSKPQEPAPLEDDVFSEEGKLLQRKFKEEVTSLSEKLRAIERKESIREAEIEYPALKEKREEFKEFLEDEENKRLSIKKAIKLFLAEQNLALADSPQRKGLEQPTGGGQQVPTPGLSEEEKEFIRRTDFRKYQKLLLEGKI